MAVDMSGLSRTQIGNFFKSNAPTTQEDCDEEAKCLTGETVVRPTAVQGGSSYTVVAGEKVVVQFRLPSSPLDSVFTRSVEQAYGDFVPRHKHCGEFRGLHVYEMNDMGGISMYEARGFLQADDFKLQRRTVEDYARFFASAYNNTPESMDKPDRKDLLARYTSQLRQLREGLPARFHATLDRLIPRLPSICDEAWPLVPNHTDLLENNIHVDPATGAITGICDWREAEVSPFGMSLSWLETMLGFRTLRNDDTWEYYPVSEELSGLFWDRFYGCLGGSVTESHRERIEIARLTGLFLANAFEPDKDGNMVPATEESWDLRYLGAVVLA